MSCDWLKEDLSRHALIYLLGYLLALSDKKSLKSAAIASWGGVNRPNNNREEEEERSSQSINWPSKLGCLHSWAILHVLTNQPPEYAWIFRAVNQKLSGWVSFNQSHHSYSFMLPFFAMYFSNISKFGRNWPPTPILYVQLFWLYN